MCPQCGAELERIPTGTPGCYDVCCPACDYASHQITTEGLEAEASYPQYHPLIEGLNNPDGNYGFGDEETVCCDDCGKRIMLEASQSSFYFPYKPVCERCYDAQEEQVYR